jgi:proteasome assembly chaperone (PAC2) family protein
MAGCLLIHEQPELIAPYIIIGYKGWLNAGEVSTGCIDYLRSKLSAHKFAHIEPQGFYIYQIPSPTSDQTLRPYARIREGLVKKLDMPQNDFFFWKSGTDHDLILFQGVEPNLAWPEYGQAILDVARQFRSPRIYSLGGIFDQVPHTRKTKLFAAASHPKLKEEFKTFAQFIDYEGPCSFTTMLLTMAGEEGMEFVSLSARTPLYINDLNSKSCYDLLKNVLKLMGYRIDLSDLQQAGENLVAMMDRAFSENPKALGQLKKLEELFDAAIGEQPLQSSSEDYDKLLEEMRKLKKEGGKLH